MIGCYFCGQVERFQTNPRGVEGLVTDAEVVIGNCFRRTLVGLKGTGKTGTGKSKGFQTNPRGVEGTDETASGPALDRFQTNPRGVEGHITYH